MASGSPASYRHWEYQSFEYLQVYGDAQVLQPEYPMPPHCDHCEAVHPLADVVAGGVLLVLVLVLLVVDV